MTRRLVQKAVHIILLSVFCWTFLVFLPYQGTKTLGLQLGLPSAHAGGLTQHLPATDLSEPDQLMKFEWRRIAGREDAVFLNIPSNQLSDKVVLPSDPNPMIVAKFDPLTNTGTIALLRMRQVGPSIQAQMLRIEPRNFQHFFGMHLYNFAWLDWNVNNNPACNYGEKFLRDDAPPQFITLTNQEIIRQFTEYDARRTSVDPLYSLRAHAGTEMSKVNRSDYYWHQRMNDDPCWTKVSLKQFDKGDGNFSDISHYGFLKLVGLAQHIHKAPIAFIATPEIRQDVQTHTKKSFFKKRVTTTVSYYLKPKWMFSTPKRQGMYSDIELNPTWSRNGTFSYVNVEGNHTFPVDEHLIYQWSQSKSGWTGLFVFVASMVLGAITGGVGGLASGYFSSGVLAGGAIGGIGGLAASGFSPTTSVVAEITPFYYSSYELNPSANATGDAKAVADRTRSNWVMPDATNTPGGVQKFVTTIDVRRALACGGASKTTDACTAPAIEQIGMDDPRFNQVYGEMWSKPHKDLQRYKYPYTRE